MTAGWGETEVPMDVSSRRLALVLHRHLAEHGLLSFLSLLGAFLLNAIKRNQGAENGLRAPLMAHRAATGSCSLARRPRARQTGWFARARVAVR